MKLLDRLLRGAPGHPAHPPLTDATIGMLVLATALSVVGALGVASGKTGPAAWLAVVGGLAVAGPTAVTGFADWVTIEWGSPPWRTATIHLSARVCSLALYAAAAWLQWPGYRDGSVTAGGLVFSLAGLAALTAGGWFGGAIVFVHRMRVKED